MPMYEVKQELIDEKRNLWVTFYPLALARCKEQKADIYYARLQEAEARRDNVMILSDNGDAIWFHNENKEREIIATSFSENGLMKFAEREGLT